LLTGLVLPVLLLAASLTGLVLSTLLVGIGGFAMSALGHKRTFCPSIVMSTLPPKADIGWQSFNVRLQP
jgi:hypothetical protein